MDTAGIIPDIIDVMPAAEATVFYPSGVQVELGKELTPTQAKDQPTVTWDADAENLYSLLMIDPDAPTRVDRSLGEILHWLVINIPGNEVDKGQVVAEFIASGPPKDTGFHRYMFLVFKQNEKIITDKLITKTSLEGRVAVKTRDYSTKYKFDAPVAWNFYEAQYDDFVPTLHALLNFKGV